MAECNIVIKGDGNLTVTGVNVTADNSYGVYAGGSITAESGSIASIAGIGGNTPPANPASAFLLITPQP